MPIDDRDKQFESALARHLRNASPDAACPDAEILAAYHERTLSLEEMAKWKEHIAECTRCQESLALVEQTEGLPSEEWQPENVLQSMRMDLRHVDLSASSTLGRRAELPSSVPMAQVAAAASAVRARPEPRWRLLLPMGAIAAAAIVWMGAREIRMQHAQQLARTQMAENRAPLPAPPSSAGELHSDLKQELPTPAPNKDKEYQAQKPSVALAPVLVSPPSATTRVADGAVHQNANDSALGHRDAIAADSLNGTAKKADSPNVPRASAAEPSIPHAQQPSAAAASNAVAQRKDEYLTTPPPVASETVQLQAEAQKLAINGNASEIEASERAKMIDLAKVAVTNRLYIVAPGEKHAWRVGDAGKIERTTDSGKTWRPQNSGVTAELTAGSATSDKVCWVIGRGGTLLLTTDGGKHWKLLSSPIEGDLGGVHATDAMRATIWDVPNRKSFETSDGGESWKPAANE